MALILAFSLAAFRSGVELTERPGIPQADFLTQLYYATGLFVLGGLDLGIPVGGPEWLRDILWVCFFIAPLATTTLVAEGLLRVIRPQWWVRSRRRDHVIVVGLGRFGLLMVEAIKSANPKQRIVVVERDRQRATISEVIGLAGAEVLIGDITHRATQEELCIERARSMALMTDDDLVNLEAAWDLIEHAPHIPAVLHVSNIGTLRRVDNLHSIREFQYFNSHRLAAQLLFREVLSPRFASTEGQDVVVIGGFGRFGQSIVELLQDCGERDLKKVLLVDTDAEQKAEIFRDEVGFGRGIEWQTMDADLADPRTWNSVDEQMAEYEGVLSFVLGTDDDALNLRLALALRDRHPDVTIALRCFHRSRFNQELAQSHRLTLLSIEDMVRGAIVESLLSHLRVGDSTPRLE